jgi:transposase
MSHLRGVDRSQSQLLPPSVEEYVGPDCPVRFIEAYVESLDLQGLGFARVQAAGAGRPPYHPADLLKLYLYGYLHRIRSSRRLEAEAGRNLELIWLLRGLGPDFKTIADFRKDNRACFAALFKQFNLLCRQLDLFGAELVAIDGCKFAAVNNCRRHYTQEQLAQLIATEESRIQEYLGQLDRQDDEQGAAAHRPTAGQLQEKIACLKERRDGYENLRAELKEQGVREVSLTDPDARVMKGVHGHSLAYNVQAAVDAKHNLIIAQDVTRQANDQQQLAPLALAAQEQLAAPQLSVVADKGYHGCDQLAVCEQAGVTPFVPAPVKNNGGQNIFAKARFAYDAADDAYRCPGAQLLTRRGTYYTNGRTVIHYAQAEACRRCPLRPRCATHSHRIIVRSLNETAMENAAARVAAQPEVVSRRKMIVEPVFGTLRRWGYDYFLLRGLEKVRAEFSLAALTYNLRRVLNLVSLEKLLAAV